MDRLFGRLDATRSSVLARRGMAACSQPLATQAALEILREGGTATDAAIGANAVLCVVEPTGAGVGGDLFALVWDAQERTLAGYNGSGRSPRELRREHFTERGHERIPRHGALSISVPGCIDGWCALHARFGQLPLSRVLEPAIHHARDGYPVSQTIAAEWEHNALALGKFAGFREQFLPEGRAPREAELFKNPNLARTLEVIVEAGRDGFYRGDVAQRIEATLEREGGFLSREDLAEHKGEWVTPVSTHYGGNEVWQTPPNTQGVIALLILNILEARGIGELEFGSPDHLHLLIEAKKLAFEDRARWIADPDFAQVPVQELTSKDYARRRAESIDMSRAAERVAAGNPSLDAGDTVYLATADADGSMVSLIQSNYRGMGSGIAPDGLGFVLQNRGELFDLAPGRFNSFEAGKRPFHTIIPSFVTRDGDPLLAFGVMGGATQPQAQAQVLINHFEYGMNLQEAGDAPRIVHRGSSAPTGERMTSAGQVAVETGIAPSSVRELARRGHDIGSDPGCFGGYQAVGRDPLTGVLTGASDARKDGHAAGF